MKIICIGRNYGAHARELGNEVPEKPVFFLKPDSAILRNNQPFFVPEFSKNVHYEAEIVVKIDRLGKNIKKQFAHRYYHEIALGIDFTARDLQDEAKAKGLPWAAAKGFDRSAPISRFIPLSETGSIQAIAFRLEKNGQLVQNGNTSDMIFAVEELIAWVSQFMTLKMGDIIFTGTPAGVGPVAIGDRLTGYIGEQKMLDFAIK